MALELEEARATIKHINARKEGSPDDKELAVDLKLEIDALAVDVLPQFAPSLRGFVFDGPDIRYQAMGPIKWEGEHINMELSLCGFEFREVKISKFEIEPHVNKDGQDYEDYTDFQRVMLTLTASFKPQGREMATIAEMLGEETPITIRARQQELPFKPQPCAYHKRNEIK